MSKSMMRLGAIEGIRSWLIYWIAECGVLSALIWLTQPGHLYVPPHWGFSVALLVLYTAAGAILGGLAGWIFGRAAEPERVRAAAVVTPLLAWVSSVALHSLGRTSLWPVIGLAVWLSGAALSSVWGKAWASRFRFTWDPWMAWILLLGGAWLRESAPFGSGRLIKIATFAAFVAGVLAISYWVRRIWPLTAYGQVRILLRPALGAACALALTFFFAQRPRLAEAAAARQNSGSTPVILISLDTVRADHMSVYGYERRNTPNLEKLAAEAEVYTRAVAAGDMTLSTHGSLFTGLFPSAHHAHYAEETPPLAADFQTLAETLRDKGYFTAAVVSNFGFLGYQFGLDQGFAHYDASEPVTPLAGGFPPYSLRTALREFAARFAHHSILDISYRNAAQINRAVLKLLDASPNHGHGTFLFINYMDAHWPYMPPPPFDKLYPGKDDSFSTARFIALRDEVNSGRRLSTESERAHLISQYDGGIAYLDSEVGKLLDYLKQTGIYDKSLIIVTSDHGEAFGERGLLEHGVSVYQDQVWVPLIVKYPNRRQKRVIEYPVSLVDVMPTVLDVVGVPIPAGVQGVSLRAESPQPRRVFAESFAYAEYMKLYPRFRRVERATYAGPRKLVISTAGKREFYDLQTDPGERRNILQLGGNAAEARGLESDLAQWLKKIPRQKLGKTQKLDNATLERLKSLGYVQ